MKTESQILDDVCRHVAGSALAAAVSGEVLKRPRPSGSRKEDVVISIIGGVPAAQEQKVSVNVNIYVQEKLQDGRYDRDEPRERILQELSAETLEVGGIGEDFSFFLERQETFEVLDATRHERCINNRLLYNYLNE